MEANPQGKANLAILNDLAGASNRTMIREKQSEQVLTELFTSLFVLESEFKFRPVVDKDYWLYQVEGKMKLYQFSPEEWGNRAPGTWIGKCSMGTDLTWSIEMNPSMEKDTEFQSHLAQKKLSWEKGLECLDTMEDILPEYLEDLNYHQRVMAFGLGKSLKASLGLSGQLALAPSEVIDRRLRAPEL